MRHTYKSKICTLGLVYTAIELSVSNPVQRGASCCHSCINTCSYCFFRLPYAQLAGSIALVLGLPAYVLPARQKPTRLLRKEKDVA